MAAAALGSKMEVELLDTNTHAHGPSRSSAASWAFVDKVPGKFEEPVPDVHAKLQRMQCLTCKRVKHAVSFEGSGVEGVCRHCMSDIWSAEGSVWDKTCYGPELAFHSCTECGKWPPEVSIVLEINVRRVCDQCLPSFSLPCKICGADRKVSEFHKPAYVTCTTCRPKKNAAIEKWRREQGNTCSVCQYTLDPRLLHPVREGAIFGDWVQPAEGEDISTDARYRLVCMRCRSAKNNANKMSRTPFEQQALWNYANEFKIKTQKCESCGYLVTPENVGGFQFDHVFQITKTASVCDLIARCASKRAIKAEIDLCQVLCVNCHCLRTWSEGHRQKGAQLKNK